MINDKRKLSEYILIDKAMRRKYGMSFEEFKAKMLRRETTHLRLKDYCDWELVDGIRTIREKIEKLL